MPPPVSPSRTQTDKVCLNEKNDLIDFDKQKWLVAGTRVMAGHFFWGELGPPIQEVVHVRLFPALVCFLQRAFEANLKIGDLISFVPRPPPPPAFPRFSALRDPAVFDDNHAPKPAGALRVVPTVFEQSQHIDATRSRGICCRGDEETHRVS